MAFAVGELQQGRFAVAAQVFEDYAVQGDPLAQHVMGMLYSNGLGVEADQSAALTWYKKAADQGLPEAQEAYETLTRLLNAIVILEGEQTDSPVLLTRIPVIAELLYNGSRDNRESIAPLIGMDESALERYFRGRLAEIDVNTTNTEVVQEPYGEIVETNSNEPGGAELRVEVDVAGPRNGLCAVAVMIGLKENVTSEWLERLGLDYGLRSWTHRSGPICEVLAQDELPRVREMLDSAWSKLRGQLQMEAVLAGAK